MNFVDINYTINGQLLHSQSHYVQSAIALITVKSSVEIMLL
jgi:hypothetical protein